MYEYTVHCQCSKNIRWSKWCFPFGIVVPPFLSVDHPTLSSRLSLVLPWELTLFPDHWSNIDKQSSTRLDGEPNIAHYFCAMSSSGTCCSGTRLALLGIFLLACLGGKEASKNHFTFLSSDEDASSYDVDRWLLLKSYLLSFAGLSTNPFRPWLLCKTQGAMNWKWKERLREAKRGEYKVQINSLRFIRAWTLGFRLKTVFHGSGHWINVWGRPLYKL